MTRAYKPDTPEAERLFRAAHCRTCKLEIGCTLLAEARPRDAFDPDYPAELVFDDDGRPDCTSFEGPEDAPAARATAAPAPSAEPEIASIALTTVGRGVVDAIRLRPGRRSWTVPYASVRELFDDGEAEALRGALGVPAPERARVHRGRVAVTITARSTRDRASVSSSVRLKLLGSAR